MVLLKTDAQVLLKYKINALLCNKVAIAARHWSVLAPVSCSSPVLSERADAVARACLRALE